jgi:AraC family transcriptional regulator
MVSVITLVLAVEFIEQNLQNPIKPEDVAAASFMSPSHLYKLFSRVFHCSPMDYVTKRRLCHAANALVRENASVTELAFLYHYNSVEGFSRAFKKQYRMSPREYRKVKPRFTNLYPKHCISETKGEFKMQFTQTPYNSEELGTRLLSARGTYFLLVDIDFFKKINDTYTHEAGDAVLAATASRIERSITSDMCMMRVGGEEFGVITGLTDAKEAEGVAKKIISYANEDLHWKDITISFTLNVGVARIPLDGENIENIIKSANEAMFTAKSNGRNTFYRID